MEDRSCRNNLHLRGVLETDLSLYVRGLLNAYASKIPADMLLADRVPKPRHLPDSVPREVLLSAHYCHIKELIFRSSHTKATPPAEYTKVKISADLSTATLRRRKPFRDNVGDTPQNC
ncbi:Hypothetical predicted protein [Pelobates cultripes]|uniref:Uncharacterized protein n=1 Tax=Pelobates cultripes TaxID=61616 RepID=A0AAD1VW80_PELCU|nr:Hypothetical predicted protein [Pelobates cultripes]